jgi:type I restriction enzyme S subunit
MKEKQEKYSLPEGWVWEELENICYKITDGSHNPPPKQEVGIAMLSARNIENDSINFDKDVRYISEDAYKNEMQRTNVQKGDVLLTIVGTIGRVAMVEQTKKIAIQRSVALLKPIIISGRYLMYYLSSPFCQKLLTDNATGTAQKGIYLTTLKRITIPLPPIQEQERITLKIEEILSSLEKSKEQLSSSLKQLSSYKQSILKQASEGTLTKEWRKNQNDLKTPQQIVNEINVYQEERYKKELRDFDARKNKLKPRKPKKIQISSDAEALAKLKLPKEWSYIQLKDVCHTVERVRLKERESEDKFIYLDIGGINNNKNVIETYKEYQWKDAPSRAQYIIEVNDILFSTVRTYLKNIAMIEEEKFNHQIASSGFAVIRVFDNFINPKYIFKYIISDNFIQPLNELQSGSSYPAVRASDVLDQFIPICSIEEQNAITEELDRQFSIISHFESTIEKNLRNIELLKQSVLRKGFEGKLSEQDFNDESARMLLKRIRVEKEEYLVKEKENRNNSIKIKTMPEKSKSILEILNETTKPISSKQLWLSSDKKDDIEEFYADLKRHIESGDIIELPRNGKESFLKLADKS